MSPQKKPGVPASTTPVVVPATGKGKRTLWERMGGSSLAISALLHLVVVVIGIFWVLRVVVQEPEKTVDFMPPSGGGGESAAEAQANRKRLNSVMHEMPRVTALEVSSAITLPEPDPSSQLSSMEALSGGSLSGGLGGPGSGGGRGSGHGEGIGDGGGLGLGGGQGFQNPFGMLDGRKAALVGNFYDLKQKKDGTPTGIGEPEALKILADFVTKDAWNVRKLDDYFKAPNTLYQTKFYIPIMSASLAPEAFGCKDVQPVFWVAHYRGVVEAPRSGRFRFVGRADNVMVVRFNRKIVLDGGDYSARLGKEIWNAGSVAVLAGSSGDRDQEREMRRGGYDIPVKSYRYPTCGQYNERGGVMVGKDFTVKAGVKYPVEIVLSELGGLFGASLMIEEDGVEYKKDSAGTPVLPLFRLDAELPAPSTENRGSPPYDPEGPVWKVLPGEFTGGI